MAGEVYEWPSHVPYPGDVSLDPDDPRPPYQQVASALRAAILTRTISAGERLPSQSELAKRYGVSRMTIQQALRILKDEGLTVSRQGSGVFARERSQKPVGLRPHVERAFEQPTVTIDFAGYTAETLHGMLQEPIDKIRTGRLAPQSVTVRMLLADPTEDGALPTPVERTPSQVKAVRARLADLTHRHAGGITDSLHELADLGLIDSAQVESRVTSASPLFKCYLINGVDAFFGFYPVVEHEVRANGTRINVFDPMGKDASLFQQTGDGDPDSIGSQFVSQAAAWFESVWNTIARPFEP